jgi:hypothetical protein
MLSALRVAAAFMGVLMKLVAVLARSTWKPQTSSCAPTVQLSAQ